MYFSSLSGVTLFILNVLRFSDFSTLGLIGFLLSVDLGNISV
jgi:hypothetical protein